MIKVEHLYKGFDGVQVLKIYDDARKIKHIAYLDCLATLEYDNVVPENAEADIRTLFEAAEIVVEKKGKNGPTQQDIIPMIRKLTVARLDSQVLQLNARICCQNPSLNPTQLLAAISLYLPECAPDHAVCRRLELFDQNEQIFR